LAGFEVVFRAGWDQKLSLFEALERNADSDTAQGFTQVGPHRADLRLMRDGSLAAEGAVARSAQVGLGGAEAGSGGVDRRRFLIAAALFGG
jgi:hypothetical protein